jgi:N-acetylneuraminic acid mutarotase
VLFKKLRMPLFEALETRALFAAQSPFTGSPVSIPGTIEAENFDKGGEGVAYHDSTSANLGGKYRTGEAVDVQSGGSNGYNVGHIQAGEWLEYTINVATAGTYRIDAHIASGNTGGKFHVSVDGVDETGPITINNTGGWGTYTTVGANGASIAGGTHVLRVSFDSAAKSGQDIADLDYLKLTNTKSTTSSSSGSFQPHSLHWKSRATNPLDREEAQSLVYRGKLLELGGYNYTFDAQKRVDAYDPKTNHWSRKHDMPYAITHAAVAPDPDGHSFWFIGGFEGNFSGSNHNGPDGKDHGPNAVSTVYKYDAASDKWTKEPSLPGERGAGGAGIINNVLYFFGGADKHRIHDMSDTFSLNLKNLSAGWKRVASFPNARNHLGGIVAGGKLYAIGGQHKLEKTSTAQNEVDRYDPATNKWTKVASLPKSESHFNAATVLYDRYIITVGGENPHDHPQAWVFAYDTVLNKWARLTDLPSARRAGVAGVIGNTLIQSTGFNSQHHETGTTYSTELSGVFA